MHFINWLVERLYSKWTAQRKRALAAHELHPDVVHWKIGDLLLVIDTGSLVTRYLYYTFQGFSDRYTIVLETRPLYTESREVLTMSARRLLRKNFTNKSLEERRKLARGKELKQAGEGSHYQQLLNHFQLEYEKLAVEETGTEL